LNREILQVSPEGDGMKVYYRMLETCDKGLLCDDNIHALLVPFPAAQHAAIRQYLRIAVEIRDSLAHGAILQFDNEARDAMGHCLAKCVQMLMVSGRTHMIRENAFYRWQARNSAEDHGLEDWLSAQKVIDRWFRQFDIVHDGE